MARCAKWLCRPLIAGVGAIRWVRYTYQFRIVVKLLFLRPAVDPAPFLRCKGMLQSEHPYEAAMEVGSRVCDCAVVSLRLYARRWLAGCVCGCVCGLASEMHACMCLCIHVLVCCVTCPPQHARDAPLPQLVDELLAEQSNLDLPFHEYVPYSQMFDTSWCVS